MSSHGADIDTGVPMPRALAEAAARLADFGLYGLVWLTRDLIVEKSFGGLVDFVTHDKHVANSIYALIGLENDILALRHQPQKVLEIPAVGVASASGSSERLNFSIFWLPDDDRPMLLAYRANSQTEMELELSKQIRARHMAESDLASKSKELARANTDLESFAAIVSHDLKAPLRHMRMIADDLIVSFAGHGDEATAQRLTQLQDLSRRMSHMLTELFDYASLGRKYEAMAKTNTLTVVQTIVDSLPASCFRFAIEGNWPVITTLAAPLDLVLRNLVQNAIQHHDREAGQITLSCTPGTHDMTFCISDDGPGINPRDHAAIFLPFRTIERPGNRGAGTGMGLAMVKKTVETAGGAIEVVSDPATGRGTSFIVHWPNLITT